MFIINCECEICGSAMCNLSFTQYFFTVTVNHQENNSHPLTFTTLTGKRPETTEINNDNTKTTQASFYSFILPSILHTVHSFNISDLIFGAK